MPIDDEAGGQRRLQHVAREPRVLADDDAVPVVAAAEMGAGRQRQPRAAVRAVIGSRLAVPRMPSVPKSLRVIIGLAIDTSPCWR